MLIGEYSSQLGDKNRVSIPKKLRIEMTGNIYLTRGYENTLLMTDNSRWLKIIKEINSKPLLSLTTREIKRFVVGGAAKVDPDSQGRFVIPEPLLSFANITNEVVFVGVGEWVEVWDKSKWEEKLDKLSDDLTDLSNSLYKEVL